MTTPLKPKRDEHDTFFDEMRKQARREAADITAAPRFSLPERQASPELVQGDPSLQRALAPFPHGDPNPAQVVHRAGGRIIDLIEEHPVQSARTVAEMLLPPARAVNLAVEAPYAAERLGEGDIGGAVGGLALAALFGGTLKKVSEPIVAWHGSRGGVSFEKFLNEFLGSGEGHHSYMYGHYFAENPKVAASYLRQFDPTVSLSFAARRRLTNIFTDKYGVSAPMSFLNDFIATSRSTSAKGKRLPKTQAELSRTFNRALSEMSSHHNQDVAENFDTITSTLQHSLGLTRDESMDIAKGIERIGRESFLTRVNPRDAILPFRDRVQARVEELLRGGSPEARTRIDELIEDFSEGGYIRYKGAPGSLPNEVLATLVADALSQLGQQTIHAMSSIRAASQIRRHRKALLGPGDLAAREPDILYRVNIHADPGDLIDLDAVPLREQGSHIYDAFREVMRRTLPEGTSGERIDELLLDPNIIRGRAHETPALGFIDQMNVNLVNKIQEAADPARAMHVQPRDTWPLLSSMFADLGIPGNRFYDQFSRRGMNQGRITRNYVIWDPSIVEITDRYRANRLPESSWEP